MKSPSTGKEMNLVKRKQELLYKGNIIYYNHLSYHCVDTDVYFTNTKLDTINLNNVKRNYRKIVNEKK